MAQITVIAPTTDAVAYNNASGLSKPFDTTAYSHVSVSADNLATTEEVDIFIVSPTGVKAATNVSGTAQKLTASIPGLALEPGFTYICSKDATASACGVYVNLGVG